MSKNTSPIWDDIQHLTVEELEEQYDIEINDDGYVWDILENQEFDNIEKWAAYIVALEESENTFVKCNGKHYFDDDY